jgi:hypothetical protein
VGHGVTLTVITQNGTITHQQLNKGKELVYLLKDGFTVFSNLLKSKLYHEIRNFEEYIISGDLLDYFQNNTPKEEDFIFFVTSEYRVKNLDGKYLDQLVRIDGTIYQWDDEEEKWEWDVYSLEKHLIGHPNVVKVLKCRIRYGDDGFDGRQQLDLQLDMVIPGEWRLTETGKYISDQHIIFHGNDPLGINQFRKNFPSDIVIIDGEKYKKID